MAKIKTDLNSSLTPDIIPALVNYTSNKYRPYDPGMYLYKLVTEVNLVDKFGDDFIELVYATLISWNMNQRAAKLSDFVVFKNSILENREVIISLADLTLLDTIDLLILRTKIESLFKKLDLVAENKPKLVTFSKTLHFFLPNLLMPIDRAYTLTFFYRNTDFDRSDENKQIEIYMEIFQQFKALSNKYNLHKYLDEKWNRNIPKIIDNMIIALVKDDWR